MVHKIEQYAVQPDMGMVFGEPARRHSSTHNLLPKAKSVLATVADEWAILVRCAEQPVRT